MPRRAHVAVITLTLLSAAVSGAAAPATPGATKPGTTPPSAVAKPKPDLQVVIEGVTCTAQPDATGKHNVQAKLRIKTANGNPTSVPAFEIQAKLDQKQDFLDSPWVFTGVLYTTSVKHLNVAATPGTHQIWVKVDWKGQQAETDENNNVATKSVTVPGGC